MQPLKNAKFPFFYLIFFGDFGDTCKMNIEMALKSRSYILDLDRVKLSLGIFFFLSCLMESFCYQLSGSTFIFVKNLHQKAVNLMFRLILPMAKVPWLFLEVQSMEGFGLRPGHFWPLANPFQAFGQGLELRVVVSSKAH